MANWTDEETLKLIEIWGEDAIQAMLEGCRRNKDIFVKISKEMEAAGFSKTAHQCSSKIKKLRFEYRKIKDKHGKTGEGRKDWRFYEAMDQVLGHKPATQPPVVVESGDMAPAAAGENDLSEDDGLVDAGDGEQSSSMRGNSSSGGSRAETPLNVDPKDVPAKTPARKGKRKRSNNMEQMEELVDKMVKLQEESERNYVKLEEKMLEMEERRQKDNQEFMMRMFSFMSN